jgi:hypothetical protein
MFKWLLKTDAEKFAEQKAKKAEWDDGEYKVLFLNCDDGRYVIGDETCYDGIKNKLLKAEPFSFFMPNDMEYFVFDFKSNMILQETIVNKTLPTSHYILRGLDPKKHKEVV